jgi:hypothetical protein
MPLPKGYSLTTKGQSLLSDPNSSLKVPSREEIEVDKEDFQASEQLFAEWDWQNEQQLGPQGEALPELATGWKPNGEADFGTGLKGFWNKAVSNVRSAWQTGYEEGMQISGVTEYAVKKVKGEEEGQKQIEKLQEANKPKDQNQAYWAASAEATKEIFNQAIWGLLEGLSIPSIAAEQALGTAGLTIDQLSAGKQLEDIDFKRNWDASRMAYSAMFDANITAEMNRRLDAGIRPDLAAQEVMIQNPKTLWPELIGQVLLDPLNVITVWGKAGNAAKIQKRVAKTFHEVANPNVARMLADIEDFSKLDDAAAYKKIDELVKSQQALTTATSHADDIATAGKDLETLSRSYKLGSLTRDGKVAHLANQTGEILMHVVNNSSPDEALEIIRGMVKSVSKNPEEAADGVATMMHFADPKALFSEAGNNTTVLIARMVEKHPNWLKTIDELKGNPVELTKKLLNSLDEVGEEMFPSVSKMLEAEKAVKAGGEVSDTVRALADRAAQLPDYVKTATKFHDTAQKFVGPLNKFFVGAYMGWNPGYAFRNFSNNSLQLLVDYGPGVLLGKADDMYLKTEKLHGGVLQGAHGFGSDAASLFPEKTAKAEFSFSKGPAQLLASKFEVNAAKRIIAKTYRQTFDKGVKAMTKALTPDLKAAGFSDDIIKKLPTYILQNDGDAGKVINALRADVASGVIDVFNDITRIDPKYKGFLESVGKWDEYAETVLAAPTREAADAAAKKIFDDLAQAGDYAYRDGIPASTVDGQFLKMAEKEGLPETRGQLVNIRTEQNRKAIEAAEEILREADRLASSVGIDFTPLKKARNISEITGWGADAAKEARRIRDLAWKLTKESRGKVDLRAIWGGYPEFFRGETPKLLDGQTLRDALWKEFDNVMSLNWSGARDTAIDNVKLYLDDLKGAGAEIPDTWAETLKQAQEGAAQYDNAMIGRFGELVEETPMEYGARTSQISTLANKYGLSSATAEGVPLDSKILRTINKYADVNYKSLEDVPLDVAEDAFKAKTKQLPLRATEPTVVDSVTISDEMSDPVSLLTKKGGINSKEFSDIMGGKIGIDREGVMPGLFSKSGMGIDDAGRMLADNGYISAEQAEDVNFVRDFIRNHQKRETTFELIHDPDLAYFDDAGNLVEPSRKRILPPVTDGEAPTAARAIHDQMEDVGKMRAWMLDDITKNFGKKQVVDKVTEQALKTAEKELSQKLAETRLISSRVAQANRDFTLLNYGEKSYWDVALAYLYPFHFWYKGTYGNWLKRIPMMPSVLAHYARYKDNLATVHAGMPEWWKYNINSNDLPGIDTENPLYFNLEATLWPLNGLTNVDFNDPSKRVSGWTYGLDYLNKFGPSTWTPINMVTGLMLYAQGEKEAGEKWMGRLFPQSATIKAGASLLGKANLETDPFVALLQGGLDPYERRRVGRALAEIEQEAIRGNLPYTQEQIQDAAYSQEGEIWDEAVRRAVRGRAPSQISSFLFGVGFKGRTQEDMQVDSFYSDYSKLFTMRPNITPEEFREGMDALKTRYPFMDTVLLSRRDDVERDAGLAYMVMQRIPPGQSSDIAEAAGVSPALLDKFYADKGQIDKWAPADRQRFMSAVLNIAAVLEIPSDMTRGEWTDAKNAYSRMSTDAKKQFGDDILDMVDGYYQAKTKSYDAADAYLERHPEVEQYMNWKAERVMGSPLLSAYYGGADMVESYHRSKMYADIEKQLGTEIFDTIDEYNDLKTFGDPKEVKAFYRQHKREISKYYDLKDAWTIQINQQVAQLSAHLPEGENSGIREDIDTTSPGAMGLANELQPAYQPSYEDFAAQIPDRLLNLVQDYMYNGEPLQESARKQLERLAREMGYNSSDDLLQAIGTSLYAQTP